MRVRRLAAGLILGIWLTAVAAVASAAAIEAVGKHTFLYLDKKEVWLTEDVRAVDKKDGTMFLYDRNGTQKMGFRNVDDARGFVGFYIRELKVEGEDAIRFWEIFATVGAHDKNCGYWLIAEENGQWRFEFTIEDLVAFGYTPLEWHLLRSNVTDGRYILTSSYEYLPEGAQFGYERKFAEDWKAELVWSEKTRSFLINPLPLG